MDLDQVKALAAKVAGVGISKIKVINAEKAMQAMTRDDVRSLLKQGFVMVRPVNLRSSVRAREARAKKKKGGRRGHGTRKGTRTSEKGLWMRRVRSLRRRLNKAKPSLKKGAYQNLYRRAKGGYFRDLGHLETYLKEKELVLK